MPLRSDSESTVKLNSAEVALAPSPEKPEGPDPAVSASCVMFDGIFAPTNAGTPSGTIAAKDFAALEAGAEANEKIWSEWTLEFR